MNIEQALESAYDDIAKSATDPNTNFSQNMKAMFEEQARRKAWERAVINSYLSGLERDPKQDEYMEAYFKGGRSQEETIKGLEAMIKNKLMLKDPNIYAKLKLTYRKQKQ